MKQSGVRIRCASTVAVAMFQIPLLSSPALAEDLSLYVVGTAYDRDSKELLYTEYHYCSTDALQCKVEYKDDSSKPITHKVLDYRGGLNSPELFVKAYREEEEQRFSASDIEELVVDAGFDNFVRSRWQDLVGGLAVKFSFQPLGFDKPLLMRASERKADGKRPDETCGETDLCLTVQVDSWLLGLIAKPIELVYSRETRRLLSFSGVSNIKGTRGESLYVDISYRYSSDG